jgi:hypothetical protein
MCGRLADVKTIAAPRKKARQELEIVCLPQDFLRPLRQTTGLLKD